MHAFCLLFSATRSARAARGGFVGGFYHREPVEEFGGGNAVMTFELAAEVRGLFEAEFERDVFNGFFFLQEVARGHNPLLIEPILQGPPEPLLAIPLKLALGKIAKPGGKTGLEPGATSQGQPFRDIPERI